MTLVKGFMWKNIGRRMSSDNIRMYCDASGPMLSESSPAFAW